MGVVGVCVLSAGGIYVYRGAWRIGGVGIIIISIEGGIGETMYWVCFKILMLKCGYYSY